MSVKPLASPLAAKANFKIPSLFPSGFPDFFHSLRMIQCDGKKLFLLTWLLGSLAGMGHAQHLHVKYALHLPEESPLDYDLFFDGQRSVFVLKDAEIQQFERRQEERGNTPQAAGANILNVKVSDGQDLFFHQDFRTQEMVSRELALDGKKVLVKDRIPQINWELTGEKRQIGQFQCQLARATWRCSEYEVWFTSAIPVNIGPWKLGGLPGLIVEAYNKTIDHRYVLTALVGQIPEPAAVFPVLSPPPGPVHSFQDFAAKQRKELEKLRRFLLGQAGNPADATFAAAIPECYE